MPDLANRDMIILAREAREYTQGAVAEALGIAQGTISKIENGTLEPSPEIIAKLSAHLGFPVDFFYQEMKIKELPSSLFRRRLTNVPQRTIKAVRARWAIVVRGLSSLLAAVEFPECRAPSFDIGTLGISPEEAARRVRSQWALPIGPITNVIAMLEQMGVLVVPFDFGTDRIDGMSVHDRRENLPPVIFVNHRIPGDRQRYTLLHELGHLIMHTHLASVDEGMDVEHEADLFASEFLLPSEQIMGHLVSVNLATLHGLKLHWKASMASLLMKADALHLLTDRQKNILWAQFSKRGWRTVEPNPIAPEEPTLLKQLIQMHEQHLGYSEQELCKLLCNISRDDMRALFPVSKPPALRLVQ